MRKGREPSLWSNCPGSSDEKSENALFSSNLNEVRLEIEKLRSNVMLKEVAMKAMAKTVPEQEKSVECVDTEKRMLLQRNEAV